MASELGTKYTCFKCSIKFYDLSRPEPICPECGADQREDPTPPPSATPVKRRRESRKRRTESLPVENFDQSQVMAGKDDDEDDDANEGGPAPLDGGVDEADEPDDDFLDD